MNAGESVLAVLAGFGLSVAILLEASLFVSAYQVKAMTS
jgi:hypothetical protein